MITKDEALNTIAVKHGHKDWDLARYRLGERHLHVLILEAMEYYSEQSNSHKHGVMQVPPTENEIRAQALAMENPNDGYATKIIARAAYESGARWAISKMSSGTTVVSEGEGEANTCAGRGSCEGTGKWCACEYAENFKHNGCG